MTCFTCSSGSCRWNLSQQSGQISGCIENSSCSALHSEISSPEILSPHIVHFCIFILHFHSTPTFVTVADRAQNTCRCCPGHLSQLLCGSSNSDRKLQPVCCCPHIKLHECLLCLSRRGANQPKLPKGSTFWPKSPHREMCLRFCMRRLFFFPSWCIHRAASW